MRPPLSQAGYTLTLPPDEGKVECAALLYDYD